MLLNADLREAARVPEKGQVGKILGGKGSSEYGPGSRAAAATGQPYTLIKGRWPVSSQGTWKAIK